MLSVALAEATPMNFWILKSEPDVYSIDDLKRDSKTLWSGVRNYQARNFMRDSMKIGDQVLFYHSNAEVPGIAGLGTVASEAQADQTAFDSKSPYFDSTSNRENPRWLCVEVAFVEKFANILSLEKIKTLDQLKDLIILRKGNRLSITPVTEKEFRFILMKCSTAKQTTLTKA